MEMTNLWEKVLPRLQERHQAGLSVDLIAGFCGVVPPTVHTWLSDQRPSNGERLIKLWHLLRAAGSDSPEFVQVPPYNLLVSELFAYDVIDMATAKVILGVVADQTVLKVLRGQPPMHPTSSLEELQVEYGAALARAKQVLTAQLGTISRMSHRRDQLVQPPTTDRQFTGLTDPGLALASLIGAALPFARQLNSDESSAAARSRLRELSGDTVFELSNELHSLCSERARDHRK